MGGELCDGDIYVDPHWNSRHKSVKEAIRWQNITKAKIYKKIHSWFDCTFEDQAVMI